MSKAVIPQWTFGDHLRKARQTAGMSQKVFAENLGVSDSAYAQWEAGNNNPRDIVAVAKRVELFTRIPASWILDVDRPAEDGPPPPHPERPLSKQRASTKRSAYTGIAFSDQNTQSSAWLDDNWAS